jgi:Holliday junction resolvasome RuvABC endonuclease subunit
MNSSKTAGLVLAIHPTSRGFGWVLFEGPLAPVDWGIASAKTNRSARCMAKFEKLLNQYQPSAIILEKSDDGESLRNNRIRLLVQTMRGFASNRDIDALVYSRTAVGAAVADDASATRYAVACAVSNHFPILRHRLPPARKLWLPEDDRQCLFDAAALGITHYALTRRRG